VYVAVVASQCPTPLRTYLGCIVCSFPPCHRVFGAHAGPI
jgi:hypothetical protein